MAELQSIFHVLPHREMREYRVALKHHANVALMGGNVVDDLVIEADRSALDGVEARDHAEKCRLSTPRRSKEGKELSIFDLFREMRDNRKISVSFDDLIDLNRNAHALPSYMLLCFHAFVSYRI